MLDINANQLLRDTPFFRGSQWLENGSQRCVHDLAEEYENSNQSALPSWSPRDLPTQWLKDLDDMARYLSQWGSCIRSIPPICGLCIS